MINSSLHKFYIALGDKKHGNGRYNREEVIDLLRKNYGNISQTAKALHTNRRTIYNYIERHKTVKAALMESREMMVDLAESKTVEKVKAGEWPAIKEVLSKMGKARGWGDSIEHMGAGGGPFQINVNIVNQKRDGAV